ncbi:hypothetical protein CDD83_4550 [Cordyceps sp. RAO-2017]|nr:hypothetical protein CDD83_4550 [Cordyceps sp. RAO-2017]
MKTIFSVAVFCQISALFLPADHDLATGLLTAPCFSPQVIGSPVTTESADIAAEHANMRYVPGGVSDVANGMKFEDDGVFSLGTDGVLRTFTKGRDVIDYRQLDPEQAKELANKQIDGWQRGPDPIPASLLTVAGSSVDGRLVTDIEKLMNPKEKPARSHGQSQKSQPGKSRRAPAELFRRAGPHVCPGQPGCSSIADCTPHHCHACFFPHGPPHGTCFQ